MKFYTHTLANGLNLVGEYSERAASCALGFFVRTGARDETPELAGVSHFLEHMMFKGTDKRNALQISFDFGAIGAQSNAFTSEESTVYYCGVLPEYYETAFDILADMLRPSLDAGEFATEKNVILEEIALYQDRPHYVLFESALAEYFRGHTAGNSVLGSIASITALTAEQMRSYFNQRYTPANMTFTVSGNFSWDQVVSLAEKHVAKWKSEPAGRELKPHTPQKSEKTLTRDNLQTAHACLLAPGPDSASPHRYAAHILSAISGDHTGSRVYWELVDKGLVESASIDLDEMEGVGALMGYVSADPERIDEVSQTLQRIMETPLEFGEEDLARAKTKVGTRLVLSAESPMRRLMSVGTDWLYRKEYFSIEDELKHVRAVTRSDIERLVADFPCQVMTNVKLLPAA
mgnify:CR=1 FL=1